jgi:DNA-binding GntR family transcriptional regulator
VAELDLAEIDELYELRRMIEPSFAAPVVLNASPGDIERLAAMADEMDGAEQLGPDQWSRINFAFHLDMYRLARRPLTYNVMSRLYHQLEPFSRFYVHGTHSYERVQQEHHGMIDALRSRDPDELARQVIAHIEGGREGLARVSHQRRTGATADSHELDAHLWGKR